MRAQFVLSEIGVGLRRNLTMTFAVIVSVALSLALFGGALLMREQVSTMKDYWYDKVNVSIYLCNKADAATAGKCPKGAVTGQQKEQIEADLKEMTIVESVHYETSDEAYKHYKEQYGETALASVVTPDQMPRRSGSSSRTRRSTRWSPRPSRAGTASSRSRTSGTSCRTSST